VNDVLGDPSSVASVIAMVASDDGAFLTGTEIGSTAARTPDYRTTTALGSRGVPIIARCDGGRRPPSSVMP